MSSLLELVGLIFYAVCIFNKDLGEIWEISYLITGSIFFVGGSIRAAIEEREK